MRLSGNLYLYMPMLKCDVSKWLSDEPPDMLEVLFATKYPKYPILMPVRFTQITY